MRHDDPTYRRPALPRATPPPPAFPCSRAPALPRRGVTLVELLVSVFILSILGWAMAQLFSTGMATWRSGETRRGAYERAQFIFDLVSRDLAALYPFNPPMPGCWSFQVDTLFSADYDGTGRDAVTFSQENLSLVEGEARFLRPADPGAEAWVQYEFEPPFGTTPVVTAVVQPKITLARSAGFVRTCRVVVEARRGDEVFSQQAEFTSGLRDQVITPNIDISSAVSGAGTITVRLRIVPEPGRESDVKLFEARADDPIRPVFRFACSPKKCRTAVGLTAGYCDDGTQYLVFARSDRGLREVAYFVKDDTLYRSQRDEVLPGSHYTPGTVPDGATPVASGIVYFGCRFPNAAGEMQPYWMEADSVPPYVRVGVSTIPLSGARWTAVLTADVSATADTIPVDSTRPFALRSGDRNYVKIDDEWIRYADFTRNRFVGCERGCRGTVPAAHARGATAFAAETFYVDVTIPAWGYRRR